MTNFSIIFFEHPNDPKAIAEKFVMVVYEKTPIEFARDLERHYLLEKSGDVDTDE